jgi:hypothetical protein
MRMMTEGCVARDAGLSRSIVVAALMVSALVSFSGCAAPCPIGQERCDGSCIDITNDKNNCGTCSNVCPGAVNGSAVCKPAGEGGECSIACNLGFVAEGSMCVELPCATGECRINGVCTAPADPAAARSCVFRSGENSGQCGDCTLNVPAGATPVCGPASCDFACGAGLSKCGSKCVDLNSDSKNCGACDRAVAAGNCQPGETSVCRNGMDFCDSRPICRWDDPGSLWDACLLAE